MCTLGLSIIHWTPTWTTGSLSCVRDHSYACVCTQWLGTPTDVSTFDLEKKKKSSAPDGVWTSHLPTVMNCFVMKSIVSWGRCSTNWATLSPHMYSLLPYGTGISQLCITDCFLISERGLLMFICHWHWKLTGKGQQKPACPKFMCYCTQGQYRKEPL